MAQLRQLLRSMLRDPRLGAQMNNLYMDGFQSVHNLHIRIFTCTSDNLQYSLIISKLLGLIVVSSSAIIKVPQIRNILRSHSAAGISLLALLFETTSLLIRVAYSTRQGSPFSTYGEAALIGMQNMVITMIVLNLAGRPNWASSYAAVVALLMCMLITDRLVPFKIIAYLQAGAGALGTASKLPQILVVWKQGGTGQLSSFAVSLLQRIGRGPVLTPRGRFFNTCSIRGHESSPRSGR